MLKFTLGETPFEIPASWHEVTVKQFRDIVNAKKAGDFTEIFSILSGLDYELINSTVRPIEQNILLEKAVAWAAVLPDWFNSPLPDTFKIGGKELNFKKDINQMSFGQYGSFLAMASANPMTWKDKLYCNVNNVDKAIAIYLYPEWSGLDFSDKWTDMIPEIDKLPFMECFAVASFFLNTLKKSQTLTDKEPNQKQAQKKGKLARKSLTNLA